MSIARRGLGIAGQAALLGGLAWAGRKLVASGLIETLTTARPALLAAAFAAAASAHLAAAGRWWVLAPAGHRYRHLARIHVESNFWATVVPGGVAADGYRILALRRHGACPHRTAASVVVERALGLAALLVLCGPALALGTQWLSARAVISLSFFAGALSVGVGAATVIALWGPVRRGRLRWLPARARAACLILEDAFNAYRSDPRRLARALAFAFAYHGLFLAAYALAGQAMGMDLPIARWFVAVPLASLAATLPLNAWGIGVREGAIVLILTALGAPPARAGAAAIAVVGLQTAVGCSGGLSQLLRRRAAPAAACR